MCVCVRSCVCECVRAECTLSPQSYSRVELGIGDGQFEEGETNESDGRGYGKRSDVVQQKSDQSQTSH